MLDPIAIYLAGRATTEVGSEFVPIKEIAVEGSIAWLCANLHALDPERHVHIDALVRPGSQDLQELFSRRDDRKVPLANDTSIGVGYAPMSALERLVLAIEKQINARDRSHDHPAWGEDIKVMGVRRGNEVYLTIACAMIGGYLAHIDDYLAEKVAVERVVHGLASQHGFPTCEVSVNAADDLAAGITYLTVTGTSAEAGDDGQVGRGNRANGLITPCRPMSLEAAAGKNPATHVGKIYNVVARDIAETLVATLPEIAAAQCLMVSQIGSPVTRPAMIEVKFATRDGFPVFELEPQVAEIVADCLASIPKLVDNFIAGTIEVF